MRKKQSSDKWRKSFTERSFPSFSPISTKDMSKLVAQATIMCSFRLLQKTIPISQYESLNISANESLE